MVLWKRLRRTWRAHGTFLGRLRIFAPDRLQIFAFVPLLSIAVLLFPRYGLAETTLVISYEDPCPRLAASVKGQTRSVGGVNVGLETFYFTSCVYIKDQIVSSIEDQVKDLKGKFKGEARTQLQRLYKDFYDSLSKSLYDSLDEARRQGIQFGTPEWDKEFQIWLQAPDRILEAHLNAYIEARFPEVQALIKRYQNDNSVEIVQGLKGLLEQARDKLSKLNQAYEEIDKNPKTPYADILTKYGLSGEWIDRFQSYEHQFNVFDEKFKIVEAVGTLYDALQAEKYSDQLVGVFTLMEQGGGLLADSSIPGISLMGELIQHYGEIAKEILQRANELEVLIRAREGFCIGADTHTLLEKRSLAFRGVYGEAIQACPLDTKKMPRKDIYVQTDPADANQLYFWHEDKFILGRAGGGGESGLAAAIELIEDAAALGLGEYAGKEADIPTLAAVYNTPYSSREYGNGIPGLRAEADDTIDSIRDRLKEFEGGLDGTGKFCKPEALHGILRNETGLNVSAFPHDEPDKLRKIIISYAMGFVETKRTTPGGSRRRTGAYRTYSNIWKKFKLLSMLRVDGKVVNEDQPQAPCVECAGAGLTIGVSNGRAFPNCAPATADDKGAFSAYLFTRSNGLSLRLKATIGDKESDEITVDERHIDLTAPYVRSFGTVLLRVPLDSDTDSQALIDEMRGLAGRATTEAAALSGHCAAGKAKVAKAKSDAEAAVKAVEDLQRSIAATGDKLSKLPDIEKRAKAGAADAERSAEMVVEAKQQGEDFALQACDKAEQQGRTSDSGKKQQLLNDVIKAESGARAQATKSSQAYRQAGIAAGSAKQAAAEVVSLGQTLKQLDKEAVKIAAQVKAADKAIAESEEDVAGAETAAKNLGKIGSLAAATLGRARAALGGANQTPAMHEALAVIEGLYADIKSSLATDKSCATKLRTALDVVAGQVAKMQVDVTSKIAGATSLTTSSNLNDQIAALKSLSKNAQASADVAEIFAEAASSSAEEAATCLQLARANLTGGEAEIVAAAEAAIKICTFSDAKQLIETLQPGAQRSRLSATYQAAVARERITKSLFVEAQGLYKAGDNAAAITRLNQARDNTLCDSFRGRIDAAITKTQARLDNESLGQVRAEIAACKFKEAKQSIAQLEADKNPQLSDIKAAYESAVTRERTTRSLWEEARGLSKAGKIEEALAVLRRAQANTKCNNFGGKIAAAIAQLEGAREKKKEPEVAQDPGQENGSTASVAGGDSWSGPWKGTMTITDLTVNGNKMSAPRLISFIDGKWRVYKEKAEREAEKRAKEEAARRKAGGADESLPEAIVGGIFSAMGEGLGLAIAEAMVKIVKAGLDIAQDDVPISFVLLPSGNGYLISQATVVNPGAANPGDGNTVAAEPIEEVAAFRKVSENQLVMEQVDESGNSSGKITVTARDPEKTVLDLVVTLQFRMPPEDAKDDPLGIRTFRGTISGQAVPGLIPTEELMADYTRRFEAVKKKYGLDDDEDE